jgi:flagellin
VTFTSTTASANVSDLTVPTVNTVNGYQDITEQSRSSMPNVDSGSSMEVSVADGQSLTYTNSNPSTGIIKLFGDGYAYKAGDQINIGVGWDSQNETYFNGYLPVGGYSNYNTQGIGLILSRDATADEIASMFANIPSNAQVIDGNLYDSSGLTMLPNKDGSIGIWTGTSLGSWSSSGIDSFYENTSGITAPAVKFINDTVGVNNFGVSLIRGGAELNATYKDWNYRLDNSLITDPSLVVNYPSLPFLHHNIIENTQWTAVDGNDIYHALTDSFSNTGNFSDSNLNSYFGSSLNLLSDGWSGSVSNWRLATVNYGDGYPDTVFISTDSNTNVADITYSLNGIAQNAPNTFLYTQGISGVTEFATVTFSNLAAGQTVSLAGRTFTAGNAGASASDIAAAMAQGLALTSGTSASGPSVGTFSGAITGWTTSGLSGANLTYTSTTTKVDVNDLTAPTVSVTQGQAGSFSAGVTETGAVSFASLVSGQSVSLAGLSFTAGGSGASANQVANAFASLSNGATTGGGSGYGTYSGTLSNWTTGVASSSVVTFTSTTSNTNVSDLTASASGIADASENSSSQILEFQSGAYSNSYVSIKTINIRTDSNGSNQVMQLLGDNVNALANDSKLTSDDQRNTKFLDLQLTLSKALDYISKERTTFASQLNRTNFIVGNLTSESTNLQGANSAILDTDFALETSKVVKGQILSQASTAVLGQANQAPSMVLRLLGDSFSSNYNIQNFVY